MTEIPGDLKLALDADESCDLDELVRQRRPADFDALLSLLRPGPAREAPHRARAREAPHRARAIYALGRWGDPAVVGAIRDLLPSLHHDERITAIDALGRLGTDEAVEGILGYANDESLPVRKFVARALGRIGTPQARAGLSELRQADPSEYIRSLAARQLAHS
jgi:HEAT repeat protein